ncbi:hypothetical protein I4100191B2_11660 [Clostridiales bacterium]
MGSHTRGILCLPTRVQPEFVGFMFVLGSKRYVSTRQTQRLKALLSPGSRQWACLPVRNRRQWLDSGAGMGTAFDWVLLLRHIKRPYFLAGGLGPGKVERAVELLHPYAVDVSLGIETEGVKDLSKMAAFVAAVRKEDKR